MGAFPGMLNQQRIRVYDKSGTITTGGTAQLIMPKALSRSSLIVQNISDTNMFVEFGGARATATVTNGTISGFTITNSGFNYTYKPKVILYGGGNTANNQANGNYLSAGLPDYASPGNVATATCVMTGSAGNLSLSSITIDNPGSGYATAPYVYIANDPLDPAGAATPSAASGIELLPQGSVTFDGPVCTTDQVSIFCATTGKAFTAKFTE